MKLSKFFNEAINHFIITLFIKKCLLCSERIIESGQSLLCHKCSAEIKYNKENRCARCGFFIQEEENLCGKCILTPPPFKKHISYSKYESKIRELILLYKYGQIELLKHYIAQLYIELIERKLQNDIDLIIPVPPDRGRLREYDTVLEITKIISKKTGIAFSKNVLIKKKNTLPQAGLGYKKRISNLNGAFEVRMDESLKNKSILLVDDVFTTGTTISKCSKVLSKISGNIYAITLAMSMNIYTE